MDHHRFQRHFNLRSNRHSQGYILIASKSLLPRAGDDALTLRPIREILSELRNQPFSYRLGRDAPFTYEVNGDRVFRVSRTNQTEVLVFADVDQWTRRGSKVVIYQGQAISII